jgi:hypothetical protein
MRIAVLYALVLLSSVSSAFAAEKNPVSYYLSFDNLDFLGEDWIYQTGLKTIEERKWELVEGRFGKGLYLGAVPLEYERDDMSGVNLDLVTAIIGHVGERGVKGTGYDQPFIWGAGKLHPGCGAVAFWVKGSSQPQTPNARMVLFEQTTITWGRKERNLIQVELLRDGTITAYVEDARYVQHTIRTEKLWQENNWNHIVFMWDRSSGLSLWVNSSEAASSMGSDTWWENQRPGLFHLPMAKAAYDEFYTFNRILTDKEIETLFNSNKPPKHSPQHSTHSSQSLERLKNSFTTDTSSLPIAEPSTGRTLIFKEITPERIHDEGIQGWWIADGRYEMAWPHEYSTFTIIPGDADFHAEKADILPPKAEKVNYITFEGNLDGVKVLKGDRNGNFEPAAVVMVPQTDGFFYGTTVQELGDAELRIPFTKEYGTPPGFYSDGDVLNLPLSGNFRLHEVGLFNVYDDNITTEPGDKIFYLSARPVELDDSRYPAALKALFTERDRTVAALYSSPDSAAASTIEIGPMDRLHLLSEPAVAKLAYGTIIVDLWITSPNEGNVLQFRLHDAAVPAHTWTHAEMKLNGFTAATSRLTVALKFDPAFLMPADRLWLELFATDGLSIVTGDKEHPSMVILRPEIDWVKAEQKFSIKTMWPDILVYSRSFEKILWQWDKQMPDVDAPKNFGGMFDMAYPWQAVLKVNPGDRIANIYKAYASGEFFRGRWPTDMNNVPDRKFDAPSNAPGWAVHFRHFQDFREKIITWWRHHQRSDGQLGGGWNDDTVMLSRAFGDMPLDSNPDALALYNNVFDGFDKTNYFKDGYCRVYPMDRLHTGDFVRGRYNSLIYNLGDPRSATMAMEEAWHWQKPDKTPLNYEDGKSFLFGKDVLEWYWGKRRVEEPYRLIDRQEVIDALRKAAVVSDDARLWRFTEAWTHTDDQSQYCVNNFVNGMLDILLGGWSTGEPRQDSNVNITVGIGWIEGGGPQLARLVEYSGNTALKVSIYSFDEFERKVVARLFRLDPGLYEISLTADQDGDGAYESVVSRNQVALRRFDTITLLVPPKVPVFLELTRIQAYQFPGDQPDLATSSYYVKKQGSSLVATVHNIGCAPSGPFTVSLLDHAGREITTKQLDSLPPAADFVPKTVDVVFPNLPDCPRYQIRVDMENSIREIFEENNTAIYISGE